MAVLIDRVSPAPPAGLTGIELIPDVVRAWPATRRVFDRYGLDCCEGPYGPVETIRYFSRAHAVDLEKLLRELREVIARGPDATREESSSPDRPARSTGGSSSRGSRSS